MATIRGGDRLQAKLAEIAAKLEHGGTLKVGFLSGATYPDGTSVPMVAAINEFGSKDSPLRPFFRTMVADKSPTWPGAVAQNLTATGYDANTTLARVGEGITGQLKESILKLDSPALKPETVKRKGFSKPLIDSGHMLNSASYEVTS